MTFVIGDIHGEITKLKSLMKNLYSIDKKCTLIFIGDYINKGENSKKVLDYIIKLKNATFLMGNHEYYLLEYIKNGKYKDKLDLYAKGTTFKDFQLDYFTLKEKLYKPYRSFFDNLKKYLILDDYFISHAGINPKYANYDISTIQLEAFLFNRYDFFKYENLFFHPLV